MPPTTETLTLDEAAELLGVHYMTAYKYVRTGRLPATRVERRWMVRRADVEALLAGTAPEPPATTTEPAETTADGRRRVDRRSPLRRRLLAADEAGAWQIVEDSMASGMEPADVLLDLLGPAMADIGRRWKAREITVAMEHQATATAHRIVGRLGTRFALRGPARGTVLIGAAPDDHHALPSAMLRDLLRGRGLAVTDLGGAVPVSSWASAAAEAAAGSPPLVAVGIGASAEGLDEELAAAIAAVHGVTEVPVIVGGTAVHGARHAISLGADHYSASTRAALELLDRAPGT